MKGKLFLVAMLVIGLVVGLAALGFVGCETDTTSASTPNNGRTIVLSGVTPSKYVSVNVFMPGVMNINTTPPIGTGDLIGAALIAAISGGEVAIDVLPSGGSFLAEIPYQVTVDVDGTVRYKSSFYFESSRDEIDWAGMTTPPTYGIRLVPSEGHIFKSVDETLSVSIANASSGEETGNLTVTVSTPDLFTLSTTQNASGSPESSTTSITIGSIAGSGSGTFSVQPKRKLNTDEELYAAEVKVTGGNNISGSFHVIFTENESIAGGNDISIGISLKNNDGGRSLSGGYTFESVEGKLSVDIENTSGADTGELKVTVSAPNSFTLSGATIPSIEKAKIATKAFTVQPDSKLSEGQYTALVTVSGVDKSNIIGAFLVGVTVEAAENTTDDPAKVQEMLDSSFTEVEYSGTKALGTIAIPKDTKLIIKGIVADGNNAITVGNGATLQIDEGASIGGTITIAPAEGESKAGTVTNNGTIRTASDVSLVTAAGTGTIVIIGTATATAPLALTQNLEIGAGGSITFTGTGTAAFSGDKKVTIAEGRTLNLGAITGLGITNIDNIDNNGTITTAATGLTTLKKILAAKGNITASGEVTVTDDGTLTIEADTTLAFTGKLTIDEDIRLKVTGTFALANNETLINGGIIEAADEATLEALLDLGTKLKGKVAVSVTEDDITLAGGTIPSGVVLTVANGQTLNVLGNRTLAVEGEVIVKGSFIYPANSTGNLKGKITVEPGGVFEYLKEYDTLWGTSTTNTTGSLVVKKGGKVYTAIDSQLVSDETPDTDEPDVVFQLTDDESTFTFTKGGYALSGAATLHSIFDIPADKVFSISGTKSVLTINEDASITGEVGAIIDVETGNTIGFADGVTSNFYNQDNTTPIRSPVGAGTYTWNATAGGKDDDGNDIPGWLKDPK
jgi:hypothetical protein